VGLLFVSPLDKESRAEPSGDRLSVLVLGNCKSSIWAVRESFVSKLNIFKLSTETATNNLSPDTVEDIGLFELY
jgi:hypothetical protein